MLSEEKKIELDEEGMGLIRAYSQIPYSLLNAEINGGNNLLTELTEICRYYKIYKKGAKFITEGTNGDYVPAQLHYRLSASLINKEARFLFAEAPDIVIKSKGDVGKVSQEAKDSITTLNDLVKTILNKNLFEELLVKAAKDCFIGKRVAGLVNFNPKDGVTVSFFNSTQFLYETKMGSPSVLKKFVVFITEKDSFSSINKRIFKKKYVLGDDGKVYLEEKRYDGAGKELETVFKYQETLLETIPAVIFTNDGLTGEESGESEIEQLSDVESWYSKLANADKDAERKNMNAIRYSVDMEPNSTKSLSSSPGSYWDLQTDQNLEEANPKVGTLESSMNYSEPLKATLDRLKSTGYDLVDVPNINIETMGGTITSGKALKAIYWPLIVRCTEKMKMWGPRLRALIDIIIEGSRAYPGCILNYTNADLQPVDYEVEIVQNIPLPEDEIEEKNINLSEVESRVMSRKAYMKKWRMLSDDEVLEELYQISLERQIMDDATYSSLPKRASEELPYPDLSANGESKQTEE